MKSHDHIYTGFVIMTIGVLLLLGNLGIISWSILGSLAQIWPLIIIAVGINLLFNNHVIVRMLTWAALIAALVLAGTFLPRSDNWDIRLDFNGLGHRSADAVKAVSRQFPKDDAVDSAELNLKIPAGALEISGQDAYLMNARYPGPEDKLKVDTLDGGARKVFSTDGGELVLRAADTGNDWTYRYELYDDIPWNLRIEAGATDADLDLRHVILKNLELNSGAGDIDLHIGKVDWKATVAADVKASDFKIVLPEGTGFRADIKGAIHDISIEGDEYTRNGDVYTSNNYGTATQKVDINLDVAVGDIQIEFD